MQFQGINDINDLVPGRHYFYSCHIDGNYGQENEYFIFDGFFEKHIPDYPFVPTHLVFSDWGFLNNN